MNFKAFSLSDIQTFIALSQEMEAGGATDLRFVRQRLQDHISREMQQRRQAMSPAVRHRKRVEPIIDKCPQCGQPMTLTMADGLSINACKKCRYSEVVAG